jgi:hypothetical protein
MPGDWQTGCAALCAVVLAISFSRHLDRIRLSRIFMIGDDYKDDRFEWSRSKAAANAKKHGVTFNAACKVFDDPFVLEFEDRTERYKEQRLITIGIGPGGVLLVAHTERGNRTRIISARKANAAERRKYRDENQRW